MIRISGPDAVGIASRIFRSRIPLSEAKTHTVHFGIIQETVSPLSASEVCQPCSTEDGPTTGLEIIDESLATVFRAPHSYTGEDCVEFSCHGSQYITGQVINLLCKNGCRMAEPGEFTKRAFLNGKLDLSQAEAVADLIASETAGQHRVAMSGLRGGVSSRLAGLRDKLLVLTSLLELELDFSDHEDLEFADRTQLLAIAREAEEHIATLSSTFRQGQAIRQGIPVAIVGKTNVGKSTLLNALLADDRAIVSDVHGTTRDTVEETFVIRDIQFRLIDTAGLRTTTDQIEQIGINRTLQKYREAAIVIHLADTVADLQQPPFTAVASQSQAPTIPVLNKIDLQKSPCPATLSQAIIPISAKQGTGLKLLTDRIYTIGQQLTTSTSDVIITNARHHEALLAALADIRHALAAMQGNVPADLIAEDLRACIAHCNTILGTTITPQDTLNAIFSSFCIGK